MSTAERMTRQAKEQAAAALSEPLVDVAFVNRCGTMGQIMLSTAISTDNWSSPLKGSTIGSDEIRCEGAKPISLPPAFLLAVTASRVHVFKIKMALGRVKLKDEIAAFERAGLEVATQDDDLVTMFRMRAPQQGQDMAFEIMRSDYGSDFAALLRG